MRDQHMSGTHDGTRPVAGGTVWLTGLSGAGKTTIAEALLAQLRSRGARAELLDGDELRESLSHGLGFSRADRNTHVTRVGFVAELLARNGVWAVVPVIAPYAEAREANRARHANAGTPYHEIHVATPLAECERRDVKGLYARARSGQIAGMTGIDDPYEVPEHPDLRLATTGRDVGSCVDEVLTQILRGRTDS